MVRYIDQFCESGSVSGRCTGHLRWQGRVRVPISVEPEARTICVAHVPSQYCVVRRTPFPVRLRIHGLVLGLEEPLLDGLRELPVEPVDGLRDRAGAPAARQDLPAELRGGPGEVVSRRGPVSRFYYITVHRITPTIGPTSSFSSHSSSSRSSSIDDI